MAGETKFPELYAAREPSSRERNIERPAVRFMDGRVVATVTLSGYAVGKDVSSVQWADLFAAAPDLCASLQEMLGTFGGADPKDEHGNAVLDRAIAAIAKANQH